ncbi:MAG TPA: addiction module protein [Planctomycetota bacterium]|jgi:putative addiction module component (TIGR02574 family)|nr:addiction module protein [Planctomycetota bacterium]
MEGAEKILKEASDLPVEERAFLVDSLLRTLNRPDPGIDRQWIAVVRQRLADLRGGGVRAIPAEDVFARLRDRFGR